MYHTGRESVNEILPSPRAARISNPSLADNGLALTVKPNPL